MKANEIYVSFDGTGREDALKAAEDYAELKGFGKKERIHIRLLTEEMLNMVRTIGGRFYAYFFIDDNSDSYRLHLSAQTKMDAEKRETFLGTSSTGKNAAARGIVNKLRDVYQTFWLNYNAVMGVSGEDVFADAMLYGGSGTLETFGSGTVWSLRKYMNTIEEKKDAGIAIDEWDELEKSIIANIADDVSVGINKDMVEMIITKRFMNK